MGDVGKKNEFLPVRYDVEALFKFLGNKVDGNYTASLDYKSIELKEKKVRKKEERKYNLSESFSLQCDTNAYKTDASTFAIMRPIPLNESEKKLYFDNALRRDTATIQKPSKSQAFWGTMGDLMVEDYKFNLSNIGSVRFSPFINPLLFSIAEAMVCLIDRISVTTVFSEGINYFVLCRNSDTTLRVKSFTGR